MWWHWALQFPEQIQSLGGRPAAAIFERVSSLGAGSPLGHLTLDT